MKRYVMAGAAIGLAVPLAFWGAYILSGHRYLFGPETLALWPSVIFLSYTDGRENTVAGVLIAVQVVLLNVLLYALLGVAAYGVKRIVRAAQRRA